MANQHRGEIEATLGCKRYTLCLTLGALAELEHAYGGVDLIALAERFERLSATDAVRILGAGLRGGGNEISDEDVAKLQFEGGAAGALAICAKLLSATFAAP
jgi:hypothetical protein